jgi:serine/threonine protein kinase
MLIRTLSLCFTQTNVLINDDGHAVLCDFGLSQIVEEVLEPTGCTTTSTAGSLRWDAPEVLASDAPTRLTPASDVWSFGCTGYEVSILSSIYITPGFTGSHHPIRKISFFLPAQIFTGKVPYYQYRGPGPIVSWILKGVPPTWPADDHHHDTSSSASTAHQSDSQQTICEAGDIPDFVMDFIDLRWKLDPEERGKMNGIVGEMESWLCLLAGTPTANEPG